ncbi:MAG: anti-sigma factor family protein [Bacteroidales bacterium]
MTCHDVSEDLLALAEGRLDGPRRAEVDAHLARCADCREAVAGQQDVARVLASRAALPVPDAFAARIAAEIEEAGGWYGFVDWRWLATRMAPVAGALLIAGIVTVEREATTTAVQTPGVSLSQVVESWAGGEGENAPATSVLWKQDVTDDSMLLTVLASPADATIGGQSDER